jgi:hypothetical protein
MKIQHRYPIGDIPDAYLTVLEHARDGEPGKARLDASRRWRYVVQFHCCERIEVLAHRAIKLREETATPLCRRCSLEKGHKVQRGTTAGDVPWVEVPWPPASTARPRP